MGRPHKKNADYFPHDSNMRNDKRIKSLRARFEFKGYAVYLMILEDLTSSDYFKIEVNDMTYELISLDYGVTEEELRGIIDYCIKVHLLQVKDGFIECEDLEESLQPLLTRRRELKINPKTNKTGVIVDNNHTITSNNTTETSNNHTETKLLQVVAPKVKERKVKESMSLEEIKSLEVDPVVKGLLVYIQEKTDQVKLLKKQLSVDEAESLIAIFTKDEIKDVLGQMDNFNGLTKKYTSVYRTCLQWLKNSRKWEKERQASSKSNSMQGFNGLTAN